MLVFDLIGSSENTSGCQNTVSHGKTGPEGVEQHLYLAHCGLYWVPGHAGVRGNESPTSLQGMVPVQKFVRPEPFLGGLKEEHKQKD